MFKIINLNNGTTAQVLVMKKANNANEYALRNSLFIILGDNNEYWICNGRSFGRLKKVGYEQF